MNKELKREQRLHKIVAASGFLFALLILPLAQYALNHSVQNTPDTGTVAGVSTDKSIINADAAAPVDPAVCEAQKQKDLADLNTFYNGKKQALLRDYQASVQQYQDAETQGGLSSADKAALDTLINNKYVPYTQSLSQVQSAVDQAQNAIVTRDCGDTSPTPSAS